MTGLVLAPKFHRAYRKAIKRHKGWQATIDTVIRTLASDPFSPHLGTHKLSGHLVGCWACFCGYDCRIIFALERDPESGEEVILLLDIGTHDEVY
jgi:mRNA-degrading endonuclease YafQ of YafQ-DinJ toxin-antitoxin module